MKIHEYQGKIILGKYEIPIPLGEVASTPEKAKEIAARIGKKVVVKAQVHVGGRGKAGGVKLANTPEEAESAASQILGMNIKGLTVQKVLVEEAAEIDKEYYIGIVVDRESQTNTIMVSAMGGVDIEEVAAKHPRKIAKIPVSPAIGLRDYQIREACYKAGLDRKVIGEVAKFLKKLYTAYVSSDANLAEINPLVVTKSGTVIATDAKFNIDDNALDRHPEFNDWKEESEEDPIEAEAHRRGLQYVRLGGDVGIIGNGAGLVMGTLDEVKRAGGNPANFLDIGGGAKAEVVKNSLELVLSDPHVKGVLFNVFGGITRCDEVAKGILSVTQTMELKVPIVVRLTGTREEEGRALLQGSSLTPAETMQSAAKTIVEKINVNSTK